MAAEVGGVSQGGPCRVELRHEGVRVKEERVSTARDYNYSTSSKGGLDGARGCRKVARAGQARHVGIAILIHGDGAPLVEAEPAELGGVDQSGAAGVELRHEAVTEAATKGSLEGA